VRRRILVKRSDLLKRLRRIAKDRGVDIDIVEGGSHTKVRIGDRIVVVPRHAEINELTARAVLRDAEEV
jgi:mRNA interferase HicA